MALPAEKNLFAGVVLMTFPLGERCPYDHTGIVVLQMLVAIGKPQGNMKQQKTELNHLFKILPQKMFKRSNCKNDLLMCFGMAPLFTH